MNGALVSTKLKRAVQQVIQHAVELVRRHGGKVSFDPNIRPEIIHREETRAAVDWVLERTSILLPSANVRWCKS